MEHVLSDLLDAETFEACAVDLVAEICPALVPVHRGHDLGKTA